MDRSERAEFRIVLDGVDLDAAARERVAVAVQKAAFDALASARVQLNTPVVVGHSNLKLRPEWRGIYILDGPLAQELGPKIEEIGFLR